MHLFTWSFARYFRELFKDSEKMDPANIVEIIQSGEQFLDDSLAKLVVRRCTRCNNPTSSVDQICNACATFEKLNEMDVSGCCSNNDC